MQTFGNMYICQFSQQTNIIGPNLHIIFDPYDISPSPDPDIIYDSDQGTFTFQNDAQYLVSWNVSALCSPASDEGFSLRLYESSSKKSNVATLLKDVPSYSCFKTQPFTATGIVKVVAGNVLVLANISPFFVTFPNTLTCGIIAQITFVRLTVSTENPWQMITGNVFTTKNITEVDASSPIPITSPLFPFEDDAPVEGRGGLIHILHSGSYFVDFFIDTLSTNTYSNLILQANSYNNPKYSASTETTVLFRQTYAFMSLSDLTGSFWFHVTPKQASEGYYVALLAPDSHLYFRNGARLRIYGANFEY